MNSLPPNYFLEGYVAQTRAITMQQETIKMEKIGGTKPFLKINETWPCDQNNQPLTFLCQFCHPTEKQWVRLFANLKRPELAQYQFDIIDLSDEHQLDMNNKAYPVSLPCLEIHSWEQIKEISDLEGVFKYYKHNPNLFLQDFPDYQIADLQDRFSASMMSSALLEEYQVGGYQTRDSLLKINGVPYSIKGKSDIYAEVGTVLQLCSTSDYPLPFTVGHIMTDNLNLVLEFE